MEDTTNEPEKSQEELTEGNVDAPSQKTDSDAKDKGEEEEDSTNSETETYVNKIEKLAERALNAILPEKKIEIMEKLTQCGIPAVPYLTKIGYKSRWPRVKKRALDLINEIYEQYQGSA